MTDWNYLIYEKPHADIARIWLNRPDARNAQDTRLLYELNEAFDVAIADSEVKVIILAAKGPHFSAGHDLTESPDAALDTHRNYKAVGSWLSSTDSSGVETHYEREKEIYEHFCLRWRDLSKPTIASVHGKSIAGGLMLIWPMDFIIASEDATFQDNTAYMGIPGIEYFAHAWELGIRKAKEFLLCGEPITAAEAMQAGMLNRVVPREQLEQATLDFAQSIANKPALALKLGKAAINATYAAQGFDNVQQAAFNAHHLAHAHYRLSQDGSFLDKQFLERFSKKSS